MRGSGGREGEKKMRTRGEKGKESERASERARSANTEADTYAGRGPGVAYVERSGEIKKSARAGRRKK